MKLTIGRDIYLSCLITLVEQIGELCESKGYIFFFFFFSLNKKNKLPMVQQLFFLIIESRRKVREIEKKNVCKDIL